MFGFWVHRHAGVSAVQDYLTEREARMALAKYVSAARLCGFTVKRRKNTTILDNGSVRLTVWVKHLS